MDTTITRTHLPDGPVLAYLAHRYADLHEPHTNLPAYKVTESRFHGACETLHALGVGPSAHAVYLAVAESCQAHGVRPHNPPDPGTPDLRGAWTANIVATLLIIEVTG